MPPKGMKGTAGGTQAKRSKDQRRLDLAIEMELHLKGHTLQMIADHIASIRPYTLSNVQIWTDLRKVQAEWKEQAIDSFDTKVRKELASIDLQLREAYHAYYLSKQDSEKIHRKKLLTGKSKGKKGNLTTVEENKYVEGHAPGDPRWMDVIIKLRQQRMQIEGMIVNKNSNTTPDGQQLVPVSSHPNDVKDIIRTVFVGILEMDKLIDRENGKIITNGVLPVSPDEVNIIPATEQEEAHDEEWPEEDIPKQKDTEE